MALGTELRSSSSSLARFLLFDDDNVDKKNRGENKVEPRKIGGKGRKIMFSLRNWWKKRKYPHNGLLFKKCYFLCNINVFKHSQ